MAEDDVLEPAADELEVAEQPKSKDEEAVEKLKEQIEVQTEDIGVLRKKLTISVTQAALKEELDSEYKDLIRDAIVPGFRKGRAPRVLVEKRYGSDINEQVKTRLLGRAYAAAVDKQSLNVLGDPLFWVHVKEVKREDGKKVETEQDRLLALEQALDHVTLPEEGNFVFSCEVEIKPDFELPELKGIPIEKPTLAVTDEDVTAMIDRQRMIRGVFEPVEDGTVQENDLVVADMRMTCEGQEIKSEANKQLAARGQEIEGVVLSDLGTALEGAKPGETRTASGTLPDDYATVDLRGKAAVFELKVNDIKRLKLPELDADFVGSLGYETEAEMREEVCKRLEASLAGEEKRAMRSQTRTWLLENVKLGVPAGLSQRQTARVVAGQMLEMARQGVPESVIEQHIDELRTGAEQRAVNDLKLFFILEKIAEQLDIHITEEDINAAIASIARAQNRRFDRVRDDLFRAQQIESLYVQIREERCIDRLLEDAEISEVDASQARAAGRKKAKKKAKAQE